MTVRPCSWNFKGEMPCDPVTFANLAAPEALSRRRRVCSFTFLERLLSVPWDWNGA